MLDNQLSCPTIPIHPLDTITFEAFYHGSWHDTYCFSIKNGNVSVQFNHHGSAMEEIIEGDNIRLKSRKAHASDCLHLLKPGVDVCVMSAHATKATLDQDSQKPFFSWHDAKIIEIKKTPHVNQCTCLFSVYVYPNNALNVAEKKKKAEVVTINSIAILQKIRSEPGDDGQYQWSSSEDCTSFGKSKLVSGIFSSEVAWLVVLSIVKGLHFEIKLIQGKIVFHILNKDYMPPCIADVQSNGNCHKFSLSSDKDIKVIRFQGHEASLRPKVESIVAVVPKEMSVPDRIVEKNSVCSNLLDSDSDVEILYDHKILRHSKRRKVEPERFVNSYSTRPNPRFTRNADIKKCEKQETLAVDASKNSLLLEEGLCQDKLKYSSKRASSKHEVPRKFVETVRKDNISEELHTQHSPVIDADIKCQYEKKNQPRLSKVKDFIRRVQSGKKIFASENINVSSQLDRKRYSERKKSSSATRCKQMIDICMGNIKSEMEKEPQTVPEWTENKTIKIPEEKLRFDWSESSESDDEKDEHEDLWKEMDHALTSLALLEQNKESNSDFFGETINSSNIYGEQPCQHDYILNEEIGQVCQKCNHIVEIRDVFPSFNDGRSTFNERSSVKGKDWMGLDFDSNSFSKSSWEIGHSEGYDSVWALIPELKSKLHLHQRRAFEFIWRNIAGSLKPKEMNHLSKDVGGCVISHSPGSGKTLLIISFLITYLNLFPKIRPLILCPKIAVYVWHKELEKWDFPFSVHQIHPVDSFKKETSDSKIRPFSMDGCKTNMKMMHVMDCLEKLKQWHEHPSILLMSYSTFSSLAREDSKFEHRRFMAGVLRKSPGILILDEGHNPRSTRSKLRKRLMTVNTEFRILLSGTLFQNNFREYFNTLSLARPRFINDTVSKLDPFRKKKRGRRVTRKEKLARTFFVEKIGQRIESSSDDDRKAGFDMLNSITSGFVDVHEGDALSTLPGLQIYTLMLATTDVQREVLMKLHHHIIHKRCPLELELLITVGSIHPWLIKTVKCAGDFFDADDLEKVEKCKQNYGYGSKAKFVIDLVHKSHIRGERVLIFCHNISPINFLVELFELLFGWALGEEVLVLKGDQELSVRAKVMDAFNMDEEGRCKVLLASTNACSEGINLVAASRVVLLDSEWNHAKTRQAIARAFRPGQQRKVYVYLLLAAGTWEEEKYNSNAWKSWLSKMIFIGKYFKYSPSKPVEYIDDEILRELVDEDSRKSLQSILQSD